MHGSLQKGRLVVFEGVVGGAGVTGETTRLVKGHASGGGVYDMHAGWAC